MPAPERALIFDVDGTLVDSNDAHSAAWAAALGDFDIERDVEVIRPLIGMSGDKLLPRLTGVSADSELGRRIVARRMQRFRDTYLDHLSPFPCVRELFERLRQDGVHVGIASSAQQDELEALLEVANVRDLIDRRTSTSAYDADASKPDPDAVQAALTRLRVPPVAAIMVGDTPYDIEAARRADVGTIAFRCGGWADRDLANAAAIYDGPREMLAGYDSRKWDWPGAPTREPARAKTAAPTAVSSLR